MYSAASPRLTIHSPMRRRPDAVGHVLRVARAGRVVVAADAADAARDEVGVARILAFHENAVAAEDRRGAEALGDFLFLEIDLVCTDPRLPTIRVIGSQTISTSRPRSLALFRSVVVTVAMCVPPRCYRRFGIFVGSIGSSACGRTPVTSRAVDCPPSRSGCPRVPTL